MIALIQGLLVEVSSPKVVVMTGGVGYEIEVPMTCIYDLPDKNKEVQLYTHFVVREDAQQLFGFTNKASRDVFRELIKINGVGPKMALAMLSTFNVGELVSVVQASDAARLVKVPGVGKKTAERLLIELKDRLKGFAHPEEGLAAMVSAAQPQIDNDAIMSEAESALVALGYKPAEASKRVTAVWKTAEFTRTQDLIRATLKSISK